VSGKAGEPGAHDHDLYCCMLHYINEKTKKEEGRSNLSQIDRLPRKLVRSIGEHRVHRQVGSVSHRIPRRAVSDRSYQLVSEPWLFARVRSIDGGHTCGALADSGA
jgi:hypothetical protein